MKSNILILTALFSIAAPAAFAAKSSTHAVSRTETTVETTTYSSLDQPASGRFGFQLGAAVGSAGMSTKKDEATISPNSNTRMLIGLSFQKNLGAYFAIQPELNYSQRGFDLSPNKNTTISYRADYIEVPFHLKGQYTVGNVTPYVLAGPQIGILVGKGSTTETTGQPAFESSLKDDINTLAASMNIGFGADLAINRAISVGLGMRYSMGLSNVLSRGTGDGQIGAIADGKIEAVKLNSFQILSTVTAAL